MMVRCNGSCLLPVITPSFIFTQLNYDIVICFLFSSFAAESPPPTPEKPVAIGTPTSELREGMRALREELRSLKRSQSNGNAREEKEAEVLARQNALLLKQERERGERGQLPVAHNYVEPPMRRPSQHSQWESEATRSDQRHQHATEGCDRRHSEIMAMMATNANGHNTTFQNSMMLLASQHQQSMDQQRLALASQQQQNTLLIATIVTKND
jgi:hypothetical protein